MKKVVKYLLLAILVLTFVETYAQSANADKNKTSKSTWNKLTPQEENIIVNKGTEMPYTGKLLNNKAKGIYICRRCNAPLFTSDSKFDSKTGWPSFDDQIKGAVKRIPDPDGMRTEIECTKCGAHLGHVFLGERLTAKNTRNCVNSLSLGFKPSL